MAFHEGKACDAVIRVLEAREGQSRRDVRSPEKDRDPDKKGFAVLIKVERAEDLDGMALTLD